LEIANLWLRDAVRLTSSVAKYFYEDGFVADTALSADVSNLIRSLDKKNT